MFSNVKNSERRGFSLIELVIVVVIIGIIGAIAIPRLSRGAEGANDSALVGDLAVMRNAVDLYATEHGGIFPASGTIEAQLTQYTDYSGATSATKTGAYIYGPYIRKIPTLTVGPEAGNAGFTGTPGSTGFGWVYNATSGAVTAITTTEADSSGKLYNAY